jgi:peptide deformylase
MSEKLYDIVLHPDGVLKEKSADISNIDELVKNQIERMFATMYKAQGIGLAANQVGITNRVFVMDVEQSSTRHKPSCCTENGCSSGEHTNADVKVEKGKPIAMINPEIIWEGEELTPYNEGCLSLPDQYGEVIRPDKVKVKYLDADGVTQEIEADGLASKCIQHEIDHLNGVLFVDHLSMLKRNTLIRKLNKLKKLEGLDNNRLVL